MTKVRRQIITIDEEKCDGCGQCIPSCAEQALRIIGGKARLVRESYCDGLGVCLGECPQGALSTVELEVEAYDEAAVLAHLGHTSPALVEKHTAHMQAHGQGPAASRAPVAFSPCPSAEMPRWGEEAEASPATGRMRSRLRQWPVQLHLVPPQAPFFQNADLTLVADCVPFACPNFHEDFLAGAAIAVGCPKLDDVQAYVDKVTQILQLSHVRSLKVAYMEVPCCRGLVYIAEQALLNSGMDIPFETVMVAIES